MTSRHGEQKRRVFFAVDCPVLPGIRALLEELEASDGARHGWLRVVPQANLHLTLRYVGPVDEQRIEELCDMAGSLVPRYSPFSCRLHGAGLFPKALWIGADVPSPVYDLVRQLDRQLVEAGFPGDSRAFRPHVTVARLRRGSEEQAEALRRQLEGRSFGQVAVNTVYLYRSDPGAKAPCYTPVAAFPL